MATVTIRVHGAPRVKRMLAKYQDPELTRRAQKAATDGAEVLRRPLQREAAKVSSRMARAVSIRQAKRNRPAAIVEFRPEIAPFRHWVIGGTKAHGARGKRALKFRGRFGWVVVKRVRGVKANPMITRVVRQYRQRVFAAMTRSITRGAR